MMQSHFGFQSHLASGTLVLVNYNQQLPLAVELITLDVVRAEGLGDFKLPHSL